MCWRTPCPCFSSATRKMNPKIARDIELHLPLRATKAAVVRVYPRRALTEGQRVQLARVPGVCPKPQVVFTPPSVLPTIERAVAHYAGVSRVDIPSSVLVPEYREEDESRYIPREARPAVKWREFQRDGLQFSAPRAGVQLWWACGAGKAPTGIVAAHQSDGLIVIVTKADVRPHYRSQVRKFTTTVPYVYGRDAPETRAETMERYVERCRADGVRPLIVTGYEGLKVLIDRIKPLRPSVCVFDEVHKAAESRRTYTVQIGDGKTRRRLGNISDVCEQLSLACERRIATSRTPIPDRRRALWSVIELTNPGEFGGQYGYVPFALRYCGGSFNPEYGGMYDQGKSATPELRARLKHFVHFVPQHILQAELPPLTREVRYIPAECQNAAASVAGEMKEAKRARDRARAAHVKLLQICSRKRDTVVEICEEAYYSGQKVLVLTGRQNEVIAIRNALCKCLGFDPAGVNGPADTEVPIWTSHDDGADGHAKIMGSEERNRRRMAYMDDPDPDTNQRVRGEGHPAVYIGTIESTGESQDFQDTDLIVFAMLSWRPKDYIQGEGRGGRIGQLRPLRIIYLICEGTSEEFIATAVIEKMGDVSDLMGDAYLAQLAEDMEGMDDPALETALIDVVLQRKVSAVSARAPEPPPMPEESNDVEDWEL